MKKKTIRIYYLIIGAIALVSGTVLILTAFENSIVFFYSPTEIKIKNITPGQKIRIGGLVEEGTLTKEDNTFFFSVTDTVENIEVSFSGILPDLFREGQGVVAEGFLATPKKFKAIEILAKHDENYMPREVADAIKASGEWRGNNESDNESDK